MQTFPMPQMNQAMVELARLPADLAGTQAPRQAELHKRWAEVLQHPGVEAAEQLQRALCAFVAGLCALPFDVARAQHAAAIQTGAWPRSLLESQHFEQQLQAMEKLALGPLARSV